MGQPLVTVAVVPRERFSFAERSLNSILERTEGKYDLIYVDGNSPPQTRAFLERKAEECDFRLIHHDKYLSPNVARNLAAEHVRTKYVAFVDNDVLVTPQWLQRLVACAEETNSWAVGPLYCQGEPECTTIHMAGGMAQFYEDQGRRFFRENHTLCTQPVEKHRANLRRSPVELLEYHTMLLRMEVFNRFGKLDEQFLSMHDHVDTCLTLHEAGLGVYMEPASVITYVGPVPLLPTDREFFSLRWCDAWNRLSIEHFQRKWQVDPADPGLEEAVTWGTKHRCKTQALWQTLLRPLGRSAAKRILTACDTKVSQWRFLRTDCEPGKKFSGGRTPARSRQVQRAA